MSASGLVLLAHGARDPRWADPFERLRIKLQARQPGTLVALAFLEQMTPDFATAVNDLVARGCRSLVVVPLFLGQGGHVRHDLPLLIDAAQSAYPAVAFHLGPAIGEDDGVLDAMAAACDRELARQR